LAGFEPAPVKNGWTTAVAACTFNRAMTAYTAHFDVRKPVYTGTTSWFEAGRGSLMALINQPSGY
jgi:hypothetical protein